MSDLVPSKPASKPRTYKRKPGDIDVPEHGWFASVDHATMTAENLNPATLKKASSHMNTFAIAKESIDPLTGKPRCEMSFDDLLLQPQQVIIEARIITRDTF